MRIGVRTGRAVGQRARRAHYSVSRRERQVGEVTGRRIFEARGVTLGEMISPRPPRCVFGGKGAQMTLGKLNHPKRNAILYLLAIALADGI